VATTADENGFAVYKQPDNKRFVIKGDVKLDNRWIVPQRRFAEKIVPQRRFAEKYDSTYQYRMVQQKYLYQIFVQVCDKGTKL
jgi:hypothetical protein